jgi:hypothetical protein
VAEVTPWTCPGCKSSIATPFCSTCGERPLRAHEHTLRGLLEHMFESFTNVDSKLLRSFRFLIVRPGQLTAAYLLGRRQPFLGPVPLFLIANVLFFAVESMTGGKVFTTPLDSHLHTQPWSGIVPPWVADHLAARQIPLESYAPIFDQAVAVKARSLIICMALFFAIVPMIVFMRRKRPLVVHAVFSLHFYAFLLLLLSLATAITSVEGLLGGTGFASEGLDYFLSISMLLISALYLYVAIGEVYGARGAVRVIEALVLTIAVGAVVLGYRFFLFLLTLYTT